ncbi:MAG: acyltransferase [Eubacterium sp.]
MVSSPALAENPIKKQSRILWMDMLRVAAIFLVIVIHVSAQNYYKVPITSARWISFVAYDSFAHIAVPLFVMISGALFLDKNKEISIKKLYTKNILRIVTAFIFWSLLNTVSTCVLNYLEKGVFIEGGAKKFIQTLIEGRGTMWFIFMIIGIYMITPLVKCITENDRLTEYFVVIFVVMSVVLPTVYEIGSLERWDIISYFKTEYVKMEFHFAKGYVGYFVLGYYLNNKTISKKIRMIFYAGGIVCTLASIALTVFISQNVEKIYNYFLGNMTPAILIIACAVFLFFKYEVSRIKLPQSCVKLMLSVSKCSFGIYLVHMIVLDVFNHFGFSSVSFNGWINVPVLSACVFVCSYLIILIISKIPVLNKYIM